MADDGDFDMSEDVGTKKSRVKLKLEGTVSIIIIVILILLVIFKTSLLSGGAGLFHSSGTSILVIGAPTVDFQRVLSDAENKDLIKQLRFVTVDSIQHNPYERLKPYDIVILDQSTTANKSIPRTVGEAIRSFVQAGGSLIVVGNSGIERPGDVSVIGWRATFGDLIPVTCDTGIYSTSTCKQTLHINAVLYADRSDSKTGAYKIMYGIPRVPALEAYGLLPTETYDVHVTGTEIAYLEDAASGMTYPAIVESPRMIGKVLYFNYNPGLSEAIFVNAIKYMK